MSSNNVKIICEIASSHCGSVEKLYNLINKASSTGCDFIKLQIFDYNDLIHHNSKNFSVLKDIEISQDNWKKVFAYCSLKQLAIIAEPFDLKSLELVKNFSNISSIKIPTTDLGDTDYIDLVCSFAKFVIVGVGGATLDEIQNITSSFKQHKNIECVLMHGFQNFPTELQDIQLSKISWIKDNFDLRIGFADHINGDFTELSRTVPCMAMSLGAEYIEKHITLNREDKEFDYYSALNPDEFKSFVAFLKMAFFSLGTSNGGKLSEAELNYRNLMKKFAVLNQNVSKGQILKTSQVDFKRVDKVGLTRNQFENLTLKKINNDYLEGTVLSEKFFE